MDFVKYHTIPISCRPLYISPLTIKLVWDGYTTHFEYNPGRLYRSRNCLCDEKGLQYPYKSLSHF